MLNLQALEQAFSSISAVGKGTIDCHFDGHVVTLSALLPSEEVAVQKFAAVALEEEKGTLSANTEFIDRFQIALLSFSISRLDHLDLRESEFIETGEMLPNGVAVKMPRHEAIRKLVMSWSRLVRQFLFRKYSELMERIDDESERIIKYEPIDLDAEIARVETRLEELKARKAEKAAEKEAKHPFRQQVDVFSNRSDKQEVPVQPQPPQQPQAVQQPQPAPVPQQAAPQPPQPRQPIVPPVAPPPKVAPPRQAVPEPSMDEVLSNIEAAQSNEDEGLTLADLSAEMAAENERLLRARQARLAQQSQTPPQARRPPPHLSAREDTTELQEVQKVGDINGTEAFRIGEVPTLSEKTTTPRSNQGVVVDQAQNNGTVNPRFRRG